MRARFTKPKFVDMNNLMTDLRRRLRDGERVVVHCNAGVGRTGGWRRPIAVRIVSVRSPCRLANYL